MFVPKRSCPHLACPPKERFPGCSRFDPLETYHRNVDISTLEIDEGEWVLSRCGAGNHCACGKPPSHTDCIVIAVDGACSNNGTSDARAGIGVYFGSQSSVSISMASGIKEPTNQKAELIAATAALYFIKYMLSLKFCLEPLSIATIKSDSEYLVRAATEWIPK